MPEIKIVFLKRYDLAFLVTGYKANINRNKNIT